MIVSVPTESQSLKNNKKMSRESSYSSTSRDTIASSGGPTHGNGEAIIRSELSFVLIS